MRAWLVLLPLGLAVANAQDPQVVQEALQKLAPGESVTLGSVTFTVHQRGEGKPDADGWYPARSKGGGFAVKVPVPFVDMTGVAAGADGVSIATHTIGGRSSEGGKFNAMCMQRADGSVPPGWAGKTAASLRKDAESYEVRKIERGAMTGLEVKIAGRGVRYVGRFMTGKRSACLVSAEYPAAQAANLAAVAGEFIDSFEPPR